MAETPPDQGNNDDEFERIMRQNGYRVNGRKNHLSDKQFGGWFRFKDASNVHDLSSRVDFDGTSTSDEANAVWDIFNMDKEVDKMKKELDGEEPEEPEKPEE